MKEQKKDDECDPFSIGGYQEDEEDDVGDVFDEEQYGRTGNLKGIIMLVTLVHDDRNNRYIVYGREGGTGEERIGFVKRYADGWNAVDTYMDKSKDFKTRKEAVEWLKSLPFPD